MKKKATIRIDVEIEFDDNGTDSLKDQAIESLDLNSISLTEADISVIGPVEDA